MRLSKIQNKLSTSSGAQLTAGSRSSELLSPFKAVAKTFSWNAIGRCKSNSADRSFVRVFSLYAVMGLILGSLATILLARNESQPWIAFGGSVLYGVAGAISGDLSQPCTP